MKAREKRGLPYRPMVPDIAWEQAPHGAFRAQRRDASAIVWQVVGVWHSDAEYPDGRRAAVVRGGTSKEREQAAAVALQVAAQGASRHWPFLTLTAARLANAERGDRFFSAAARATYQTHVVAGFGLIGGRYFVTFDTVGVQRRFTLRRVWPSGVVDTVGAFMGYTAGWLARDAALAALEADLRTERS